MWVAFALAFMPVQASAHLKLESSVPAKGDTIRVPLHEIRITFTQAVEPRYTTVTLVDNAGVPISLGTLEPIGTGKTREFVYKLSQPLAGGDFVVQWKTAGADGHVVSGSFDFTVAVRNGFTMTPTAPRPPAMTAADPHAHQEATEIEAPYRPDSVPWVLARWLNFIGLMLMVGAIAFRFAVLQRSVKALAADVVARVDNHVRTLALIAAVTALAANMARIWLQSGALHGSARVFEGGLIGAMIMETGWGKAWLAQSIATIGFLITTRVRTQQPLESWISSAIFGFAAASTPAFAGHAAAVEQMAVVPIFNDAIHLIAAASWLGTLAVLLFAAVPAVIRASQNAFTDIAVLVRTFSPFALFAAAVAIATGTFSAFVHIRSISELWTTPYGKTLAIKLLVVMLTATTGAYNWKVVSPSLGSEAATRHIRRSALAEIIIAATILAVTAVLVALPLH